MSCGAGGGWDKPENQRCLSSLHVNILSILHVYFYKCRVRRFYSVEAARRQNSFRLEAKRRFFACFAAQRTGRFQMGNKKGNKVKEAK